MHEGLTKYSTPSLGEVQENDRKQMNGRQEDSRENGVARRRWHHTSL